MQDFTGVPAVVDLAAMRDAMVALGGDPKKINPLVPVDLVIDHSVQVDAFGSQRRVRAQRRARIRAQRRALRLPALGLARRSTISASCRPAPASATRSISSTWRRCVWTAPEGNSEVAYPDTLVGTDSHTTMVNGLGVLGWGVGGIEAEAAMLGQPVSMLIPEVVGFKLTGALPEGVTATDLVLTVTQMLRKKGVVGKFVEFFGPGVGKLPLADRATIANMAPEYGATCGFFPVDEVTLDYLRLTGRAPERVALVEAYAKAQGMWRHDDMADPVFTDTLELDLATVEPSLAGPKRPQDRVPLTAAKPSFEDGLASLAGDSPKDAKVAGQGHGPRPRPRRRGDRRHHQLHQHQQPGRDDRRRPGRQEGGRAGPHPQAVGQDLAGPGLARGHRLSRQGRPAALRSTRSASTWSAMAARPASATPVRCPTPIGEAITDGKLVVAGGALRQPQLRGPRPRPGQGQLPGLAAAGRRLRAGRLDADRHHHRAARHRQGRQARST